MDLSLVPINDLMKEMEQRCTTFLAAWQQPQDKFKSELKTFYGKGDWSKSIALSNMLNNDVLNNWNGELQTLQRIAQEDKED